jgi:uncharacterized membrane protein YbhN (UPF0104 family)
MKARLLSLIKYLWLGIVVVFLVKFLLDSRDRLPDLLNQASLSAVLISLFLVLLSKFLLGLNAFLILKKFGYSANYFYIFHINNISQLGKYIPGSIWQFVGKAGHYIQDGLKPAEVRSIVVLEAIWILGSSFLIGIFTILHPYGSQIRSRLIAELQILIPDFSARIFILLGICIAVCLLAVLVAKFRKRFSFLRVYPPNMISGIVLLTTWVLLGLSIGILYSGILDLNYSFLSYSILLFCLSYSIGYIIPFAPAGIGIREAVLILGLSLYFNSAFISLMVFLHRVIYVVADLCLGVVSIYLSEKTTEEKKRILSFSPSDTSV